MEASTSEHFPHEATAAVSFVPEDGGVFVATVVEQLPSGEFHLAAGTGIGLVGCHEGEDVLVTLWSDKRRGAAELPGGRPAGRPCRCRSSRFRQRPHQSTALQR